MNILPRGNNPPAPCSGSQMFLQENLKDFSQNMRAEKASEMWSDQRRTTGIIGIVTMFFAAICFLGTLEVKKIVESCNCINEHEFYLPTANVNSSTEYSCICQQKELLTYVCTVLLVITAAEVFAGMSLINAVLEKKLLFLHIWTLFTILWILTFMVTSMVFITQDISTSLVLMILGQASIVIVLGYAAMCVVLLYWVELWSEEKLTTLETHGRRQTSNHEKNEESSNGTSIFLF